MLLLTAALSAALAPWLPEAAGAITEPAALNALNKMQRVPVTVPALRSGKGAPVRTTFWRTEACQCRTPSLP